MSMIQYVVLSYAAATLELLQSDAKEVGAKPSDRPGKSESRRKAYFAGRAALAALFRHHGIKSSVSPAPFFGYLRADNLRGVYVNVSHTDDLVVAAMSPSPVGIDIENTQRDASRVLKRVSLPEELLFPLEHPLGTPGGDIPFGIALWSAKEAFSKALGLGITFGMQALNISLTGQPPFACKTHLRGPLKLRDPAIALDKHGDYLIAVCSERSELQSGLGRLVL